MAFESLVAGVPGAPELLVLALISLVPIAIGAYLYYDARKREAQHPIAWALAAVGGAVISVFAPIVAVPVVVFALYFAVREELGPAAPPTVSETEFGGDGEVLGEPLGSEESERTSDETDDAGSDLDGPDAADEPDRTRSKE